MLCTTFVLLTLDPGLSFKSIAQCSKTTVYGNEGGFCMVYVLACFMCLHVPCACMPRCALLTSHACTVDLPQISALSLYNESIEFLHES